MLPPLMHLLYAILETRFENIYYVLTLLAEYIFLKENGRKNQ
jgi:hypothetical protein